MSPQFDAIVVGLGAAGTAAASTLARAGKRVLALEAQDRVGGRVNTVPFGNGVVELGAEWIHGTVGSRVYDLAVLNNIAVQYQDLNLKVFTSDGAAIDEDLVNELVGYVLELVEQAGQLEPLGEFITRKLTEYLSANKPEVLENKDFFEQLLEFLDLLIDNYEASNTWNDVSSLTKYEELEGHQHASWHKNGYWTLFDILLNKFNNGPGLPTLETKLGTEVQLISWPQDPKLPVSVTTTDGSVYTAEAVIVTVSLGVLKEKYKTMFAPHLPPKKAVGIENLAFGVMDKVILSFPHVWWPKDRTFYAFIWRGKDKEASNRDWHTKIFGASSPFGSENALTLWTNGETSKLVETLPDDVVKRKCMELLRKFMGQNVTVPEPTGIVRSKWWTNPYTRGSYTFDSIAAAAHPTARADLATPLLDNSGRPRVLFAGEATDPTHFSTVHGAVDSGYREAARLLPSSKI